MVKLKCGCYADLRVHNGYYFVIVRSPEGDRQVEIHYRTSIYEDEPLREHISEIKEALNEVLAIIFKSRPQLEESKSDLCSADREEKDPQSNSSQIAYIAITLDNFITDFVTQTPHYMVTKENSFRPPERSPPLQIVNLSINIGDDYYERQKIQPSHCKADLCSNGKRNLHLF